MNTAIAPMRAPSSGRRNKRVTRLTGARRSSLDPVLGEPIGAGCVVALMVFSGGRGRAGISPARPAFVGSVVSGRDRRGDLGNIGLVDEKRAAGHGRSATGRIALVLLVEVQE